MCEDAAATEWWQLSTRYLSCRPINEIGDFLSGAFAPVAFAWLVATVFIQSEELKAQRQELRLTRHEFELNRDVAVQQRDAMRAQGDAAAAQTELALRASDLASREAKDRETEDYLQAFVQACRYGDVGRIQYITRKRGGGTRSVFSNIPDSKTDACIFAIDRQLRAVFAEKPLEVLPDGTPNVWEYRLRAIYDERYSMTGGQQKRVENLPLIEIADALTHWVIRDEAPPQTEA